MKRQSEPKFNGYAVLGELGRGAMGVVYKARSQQSGKIVAIKTLKTMARNRAARDCFFHEIQVCQNLIHHNIVIPFDFEEGPIPYIVMEYIDGTPLSRLNRGVRLDLLSVAEIIDQIGEGLRYVHDVGVVHGDLNPHNIMITRDHRQKLLVKILDFGTAKTLTTLVRIGSQPTVKLPRELNIDGAYGTPGYISPELFKACKNDMKADLFSFGVIAHELITGETPFPGDLVWRTLDPPRIAVISKRFENIFLKIFAETPADRYASATDFSKSLIRLLRSESFHKKMLARDDSGIPGIAKRLDYTTDDLIEWEKKIH